jgi:hypothetical protein
MELTSAGRRTKIDLRVSCQPFRYGPHSFVVLVLEGLKS